MPSLRSPPPAVPSPVCGPRPWPCPAQPEIPAPYQPCPAQPEVPALLSLVWGPRHPLAGNSSPAGGLSQGVPAPKSDCAKPHPLVRASVPCPAAPWGPRRLPPSCPTPTAATFRISMRVRACPAVCVSLVPPGLAPGQGSSLRSEALMGSPRPERRGHPHTGQKGSVATSRWVRGGRLGWQAWLQEGWAWPGPVPVGVLGLEEPRATCPGSLGRGAALSDPHSPCLVSACAGGSRARGLHGQLRGPAGGTPASGPTAKRVLRGGLPSSTLVAWASGPAPGAEAGGAQGSARPGGPGRCGDQWGPRQPHAEGQRLGCQAPGQWASCLVAPSLPWATHGVFQAGTRATC